MCGSKVNGRGGTYTTAPRQLEDDEDIFTSEKLRVCNECDVMVRIHIKYHYKRCSTCGMAVKDGDTISKAGSIWHMKCAPPSLLKQTVK